MAEVRNRKGNESGQEDISNLGEAIQTAGDSKHRSDHLKTKHSDDDRKTNQQNYDIKCFDTIIYANG